MMIALTLLIGALLGLRIGYRSGKENMLRRLETHLPADYMSTDQSAKDALAYERAILEGRNPPPCAECLMLTGHLGHCTHSILMELERRRALKENIQ